MSGTNMGDWFGGSSGGSTRGSGQSWPMSGLWEAMEQLRGQFEQKVGGGGFPAPGVAATEGFVIVNRHRRTEGFEAV